MIDAMAQDQLLIALQITVIGSGLVFGAIVLLWLLMTVLVSITTTKKSDLPYRINESDDNEKIMQKIAVAAVATATSLADEATPHEFPLPSTALVSAWQAVMRTDILKKHGKTR